MANTRSVGHLLNNSTAGLAKVIQRSKDLQKLTTALKNMVDAPLCEHIYVANIRDVTLVIGTDSAVWHTRIKYLSPVILEQMRLLPGLEKLRKIEFRVQPFSSNTAGSKPSASQHTSSSPSQHKAASESSGNALKQAIQRISKKIGD
ncbi:DciA family protein [Kaarinaea lacus]